MNPANEFRIRSLRPGEDSFIYSTFINGFVKNSISNLKHEPDRWKSIPPVFRTLPVPWLCTYYHDEMEQALQEGQCIVAIDPDDSILIGYAVFRPKPASLVWTYAKPEFKEYGIEHLLIKACGFERERHVFLPFRTNGLSKLLREMGLREI